MSRWPRSNHAGLNLTMWLDRSGPVQESGGVRNSGDNGDAELPKRGDEFGFRIKEHASLFSLHFVDMDVLASLGAPPPLLPLMDSH